MGTRALTEAVIHMLIYSPPIRVVTLAKKLETVWEIDPHTQAKHAILRRYWEAWLPIMATFSQRLLYIDGFAGPGKYSGGEDGSPLIALKAARDHSARPRAEVVFIFIEKDQARFEHLETVVAEIKPTLPVNFYVNCVHGTFDDQMTGVLDDLDAQKKRIAPSLVFIDPFGFSHTPFHIVQRIMQNRRCETLITFMYEEINRFLNHPDHNETYDSLFGTAEWRRVLEVADPERRRRLIHDTYRDQLRGAGIEYVRSFEMLNLGNRTDYFLFFGTNNLRGLEKMKEAMWKIDPAGSFHFSDFTDANKTGKLFLDQPDFGQLKGMIVARFRGKVVSIEDLTEFVISDTPFLRTHFKTQILKPMELQGELSVVKAKEPRRKGTFPEQTIIRFREE
jgi:three-Cys-motif partner protein